MSHLNSCKKQKHIRFSNNMHWTPRQNILVTWTKVKTLHKQQTSHMRIRRIRQYSNQSELTEYNCAVRLPFQSKALRMIVDAPWYVPNTVLWRDLHTPTVNGENCSYSCQYSASLSAHQNDPVVNLMAQPDNNRWLWSHLPNDLPTRFLV
jgi:hypothetical protein